MFPLGMNVMTFHDGTLVEKQPSCGQMICPLADFEAAYKHFANQDFNSVCGIWNFVFEKL